MSTEFRPCAVVPVYRHGYTLRGVARELLEKGLEVIIVDDGNVEPDLSEMGRIAAELPGVELVRLEENCGKGRAFLAGLARAEERGYTHALQVDADGQHDLTGLDAFLEHGRANPTAIVCGRPVYDESAPSSRRNGRKITNVWVAIETLSGDIEDAMCGLRLYPVGATSELARRVRLPSRMTFDIEVLVRLHWLGIATDFLPVKVRYPEDGVSNFRMFRDNAAISLMHTRLFFGMLPRLPLILARRVFGRVR